MSSKLSGSGDLTQIAHLELRSVTKRYGATLAVNDVDLTVARGTVHALVGENGAGKSTLGKIVAGIVGADEGRIEIDGQPVELRSPRQALELGITAVAQELALVPGATAVENAFLGIESSVGGLVQRRRLNERFARLVETSGIEVRSDVPVGSLSVAEQQKVEILRALARQADFIVMDEPTARLSTSDASGLMDLIHRLADSGVTIVLISHHLDEVLANADAVTIMRDGEIVRTGPASDETHDSLIEGMIGRSLARAEPPPREDSGRQHTILAVSGLSRAGAFADVSFSVDAGEIVVMAGLVGAGRTEVVRAIYGADPVDSGSVVLNGREVTGRSIARHLRSGMAMIPESRKDDGLVLQRSVRDNVTLASLDEFSRAGFIESRRERAESARQVTRLGVRAASNEMPVINLSGGNQQKVMFARGLLDSPHVLIADEPTRGVDIGAKHTIYDLLFDLARDGMGLLVVSSELDEVVRLAHRVLVMAGGRIVAEFSGADISEDSIMHAAFETE